MTLGRLFPVLGLAACSLPTASADRLRVDVAEPEVVVTVGQTRRLSVQVLDADGNTVAGPGLAFRSADEDIALVTGEGVVLGARVGNTSVIASLRTFQEAGTDTVTVRVVEDLRVDWVSADTVRFGQTLTLVGTTLEPADLQTITIGGWAAPVVRHVPATPGVAGSRDTLQVVVPAGPTRFPGIAIQHVNGSTANWPVTIVSEDIYEPNNAAPFVTSDPFVLTNSQAAFETTDAFDWYRIVITPGVPFTLEVRPGLFQIGSGDLIVSAPRAARNDLPAWSFGPDVVCRGLLVNRDKITFTDTNEEDITHRIPFSATTADTVDVFVSMPAPPFEPRPYSIDVRPGIHSDEPPDGFESNDDCLSAVPLTASVDTVISFHHTLDDDWFRISVGSSHRITAQIECESCTTGYATNYLALHVYKDTTAARPSAPGELPEIAYEWGREFASLFLTLPAGDYFLLAHNETYAAAERVRFSFTLEPGL